MASSLMKGNDMKATLKTLKAQKLEANEAFALRNHNGTLLAESTDAFKIKGEQEMYQVHTGNDTHVTIEASPAPHYEEDVVSSRELNL
jgi:hypothetical protein|tara:strand:- start:299 stop:562 length:264 start_codon:yes stop_codon:yes gene_type:complete